MEDFWKAENLYKAGYDEADCENEIKNLLYDAIHFLTDIIEDIVTESAEVFKGTVHEDIWVFNHDALSLMTAGATIACMKYKDYYKGWVLPVNGLNKEVDLCIYSERPVGNSPEFMPWD